MVKVSWAQLPSVINLAASRIVEKRTRKLYAEIVSVWPVKTGKSKAGWKVRGYKAGGWAIVNFVKGPEGYNYVADLWYGLPKGSSQLPNGGYPVLARHLHLLKSELRGMKL